MDILERLQQDKVVKNWQFWDDIKCTKTTGTPSRVKAYLESKASRTNFTLFSMQMPGSEDLVEVIVH